MIMHKLPYFFLRKEHQFLTDTMYGAQNEVYNDDWAENGLIVLCFS